MENNNIIESAGFYFIHNFDSGNLGHVQQVPHELIIPSVNYRTNILETPDYEFNLWTRPDCAGTEFENGNRTWFYFGIQGGEAGILVRLNLVNLNKQGKMYNQGMAPVTRTLPGKPHWERIRDRPVHSSDDNTFILSFKFRTPENTKATTFFAFTYPFSFAELQIALNTIDLKFLPLKPKQNLDDIYYCRESVVQSLDGRRVDLLTISSYHGLTDEREPRLKNLFPESTERPFKFQNKKVIFISARVHPGETPSSFVFNGFLNLLLTRNDPIAISLRKIYVFKMIPFLNPDGVARGHYRTDTRGVNLNRVYLNPSLDLHPTVYAARALIRYYHYGYEKEEDPLDNDENLLLQGCLSQSDHTIPPDEMQNEIKRKKLSPIQKVDSTKKEDRSRRHAIPEIKSMSEPQARNLTPKFSIKADIPKKEKSNDSTLASQVFELKLNEMKTQTEIIKAQTAEIQTTADEKPAEEPKTSLLDDVIVRDCLGSEVHLSKSDELNIQGPNPLRQLRDTLKNSISLLIGTHNPSTNPSRTNTGPLATQQSSQGNVVGGTSVSVRVGWCDACQRAVSELECHMPGIASMLPAMRGETTPTDLMEDGKSGDFCLFCSNCFKPITREPASSPQEVKESSSNVGSTESAGDTQELHKLECNSCEDIHLADSNGDKAEQKSKLPLKPRKKLLKSLGAKLKEPESGLYLYIDLHGHASKKGIFMYGNHFEDVESCVECMLLPRIMSLNNLHFHFSSCNFTERNMYLRDRRDGMSREGSGRVAVLKATGLVRSYTLECNYNTGRLVNILPPTLREAPSGAPSTSSAAASQSIAPPKYNPQLFEEVGRSLGSSILDMTSHHPNSRIPGSEHRNLSTIREWLRGHTRHLRPQLNAPRLRSKGPESPTRAPLYARSFTKSKITEERKENTYAGAKPEASESAKRSGFPSQPGCSSELVTLRYGPKRSTTMKVLACRPRFQGSDANSVKSRPLSAPKSQRSVLGSIKKPNVARNASGKSIGGGAKAKEVAVGTIRKPRNFSGQRSSRPARKDVSSGRPAPEIKKSKLGGPTLFRKASCSKTLGKKAKIGQFGKEKGRPRKGKSSQGYERASLRSSSASSAEELVATWDNLCIPTILDGLSGSGSEGSRPCQGRAAIQKVVLKRSKTDLKKIRLKSAPLM